MAVKHKPVCPDCSGKQLKRIGKLPESNEFSGNVLDYYLHGGELFLCSSCKLKFRFPVLSGEEYSRLYNTDNINWIFDENRNDWKILKKFIENNVAPDGLILDFGCNFGDVLARLPLQQKKIGIEINRNAAQIAGKKPNTSVYTNLEELPPGLQFDLIYTIDVIEHLISPGKMVSAMLPYLKKGGFIVIMTGDSGSMFARLSGANWYYSAFPEHISFISKTWVRNFCRKTPGIELFSVRNYIGTTRPFAKRIKWFFIWTIKFVFRKKSKFLFHLLPGVTSSGMAEMKNYGKNFSADHLFAVFKKL